MVLRCSLVGCWGLLLIASTLAAEDKPADDTNTAPLRKQFDKADQNKDGFLDVAELAKAVRGPQAKSAPKWVYAPTGNPTRSFSVAKHFYPDALLLWSRDNDGDHRVSWEEYLQYESSYRDAVAQNPRLTRKEAELQIALQNLQGGSQPQTNFSTNPLAAPGRGSPLLAPVGSATSPLPAGAGGKGGVLTPPSFPQSLNSGLPNLAAQLGQTNFSPRALGGGSSLSAFQAQQYEKYLAGFDQRYFVRFCHYFPPGTSPAYIMPRYLTYKRNALLNFLQRTQARNMGILP